MLHSSLAGDRLEYSAKIVLAYTAEVRKCVYGNLFSVAISDVPECRLNNAVGIKRALVKGDA